MSTLAEFLKEQGERIREDGPKRETHRKEWEHAISTLYDRLEAWIRQVDQSGLLVITRERMVLVEVRLGRYDMHRLKVELDGSFVEFTPVQRFPGGSIRPEGAAVSSAITGLVSVGESGLPYKHLYRIGTEADTRWFVSAGVHDDEVRYEPLTQERFERLLVRGLT